MIGRPYLPSNGTEGEIFMAQWCDRCAKDNFDEESGEGGCPILLNALFGFHVAEWVYGDDDWGSCTAFVEREE